MVQVLWHDDDSLGMNGADWGLRTNQPGKLHWPLCNGNSEALEMHINLEILCNFSNHVLER